jgi:hypothetical protein
MSNPNFKVSIWYPYENGLTLCECDIHKFMVAFISSFVAIAT